MKTHIQISPNIPWGGETTMGCDTVVICGNLISMTDSKLKLKFRPDFFSVLVSFTTTFSTGSALLLPSFVASSFCCWPDFDRSLPPDAFNNSAERAPLSSSCFCFDKVDKFSSDLPIFPPLRCSASAPCNPVVVGMLPSLDDRVVLARSRRNFSRSRFWPNFR